MGLLRSTEHSALFSLRRREGDEVGKGITAEPLLLE
jgi:hypothetical protein